MPKNDQDARGRIIQAATEILNEIPDTDKITVRQIAERANVGIGLINYHFHSKNNLLSLAIGDIMAQIATDFQEKKEFKELKPVQKLKAMLCQLCNVASSKDKLIHFMLSQEIMSGKIQTPLYLIPILREIFGKEKEEIELRLIALQILHPIQVAGLSPVSFRMYSGIDLSKNESRNHFIDVLVTNLIHERS